MKNRVNKLKLDEKKMLKKIEETRKKAGQIIITRERNDLK